MKFLVAGDSWGRGEWPRGDIPNRQPSHGGLAQYMQEAGIDVVNLSEHGGSNIQIQQSLRSYLERQFDSQSYKIFVFQTEYIRDSRYDFAEDWDRITDADTLSGIWISRFYSALSQLAIEHKCKIYLIGGCSDTLWFDDINQYYPGLEIACQSMVNLILNGKTKLDGPPVLSWYGRSFLHVVEKIKKKLPPNKIDDLIGLIDVGMHRQNLVWNNPEYFYPDGVHPNRAGHKILFDYLKDQGYFD